MPEFQSLTAISPIDGRYRSKAESLAKFFSEFGLIRYRVLVEIEYFIALCELPLPQLEGFDKNLIPALRKIYEDFTLQDAEKIKSIESVTNHDVKAVEYFIKDKFDALSLQQYKEFIHFGLTSQDINNTAVPASLRDALNEAYYPVLESLIAHLELLATEWKDVAMLARTHGQPASPTRLGKEIIVFVERLRAQLDLLKAVPVSGKFGGATGNFNAHNAGYPSIDWDAFANSFLENKLKIKRERFTTQISNYDNLAALFDGLKRINTVLLDLSRDMWTYIMMEYFKQKIKKGEVGSSAMPHKVNPIDFENAEGNLGIANAVFEHLAAKLPVSRLQRDLTDSTVLRNIGVPISHSIIAIMSVEKGLSKLLLNKEAIDNDLEENWAVVAEGVQTILRREGYPNPYEALKELTRTNEAITRESIARFIDELNVAESVKAELRKLSPSTYTGISLL
ncbi:adenylosuccinate lyase [Xiashengella succiniciproducens]|jgi:adenylosuccinate lyase|uniref:Adenylosuccinate lyase n=1 Tax=Xiashengella succiniciproducens TaxID=2949635 RepID=A0A9J6ZM63_9BACT|nr:adenylosuccinate lyase [Alkaliflexus sp. Ai-910]URW78755.1 adenylosuccinate lyase [Alkaliflexus sp. Ai-910]HHU01464.1 adenylosuccinate lyase [Bacteroidales bacterium]